MPLSDARGSPIGPLLETPPGQALAVWAETLYLCNLLLLPGIAFAVLLHLYFRHRASAPALAVCHLRQTVAASLWAGVFVSAFMVIVIALSDYRSEYTWVAVISYLVCIHSALVMLGVLGLAKAMAGQKFIYPLIGKPCA